MRLIKYAHSCVRVERDDRALVIDPGCWTEPGALDGAGAVLVSHAHNDHVTIANLVDALEKNPALRVYGDEALTSRLTEEGEPLASAVTAVGLGEEFEAAGFHVTTFGGPHAHVYGGEPDIVNVGYLVDGLLYHPGDSLTPPGVDVHTLLVPVQASWMKLGEAVDFVKAVGPVRAHPIHDGQLHPVNGMDSPDRWISRETGVDYVRLPVGEPYELTFAS